MNNLFETLGGDAAISVVVDTFYDKVLQDERIKHFFANTDMNRQRKHQKAFLTVAFGGPNKYTGASLKGAHKKLVASGLNDMHYDAVVELLGASLREHHVPDELIAKVAGIAESVRDDVLGRAQPAKEEISA